MAELNPEELRKAVKRWPLLLGVLVFICLAFYLLKPILLPFVVGGLLAYLGDPAVDVLERRKINRSAGVAIVFVVFTALLGVALLVLVPLIAQQLDALVQKIPVIYAWLTKSLMPWLQSRFNLPISSLPELNWSSQLANNWESLGKMVADMGKKLTGSGFSLLGILANLALVPVVAFYLMRDWDLLVAKALHMLPVIWQDKVSEMVSEADEVIGAFLRGQFFVMCALGLMYSIGLWMIGIQFAFILGLIAGLASIVPYLGFVVGIVVSCIAAYAQYGDFGVLLLVALVFGVGQMVESMLLTPILVGDRIGLHPVAVIFALMAGGQLAGFMGVVLALPVAAVIMVFARHAVRRYRASDVYRGEGS